MSYTITRTDGTILLTLSDTKVDQLTTSLALIGKNVDSYGQYLNNDLVGLLENFAGLNQPRSPIVGQLWYNKVDGRMYVYGMDKVFKPVAGAQVTPTQPTIANQGDLWIDSGNNQLYFTPDGTNFTLVGPQYSAVSGKSGWLVETITDTAKNSQVVASLYSNNALLGIASAIPFTFEVAHNGMNSVQPGFNLNQSIPGIRFVGTATSADSVQGFSPNSYLANTGDQTLVGGLSIRSDNPGLYVGNNQNLQIYVDSTSTNIVHDTTDSLLRIRGVSSKNSTVAYFTALAVDSLNERVGLFTEIPQYPVDINGDTRIQGNLVVQGNVTNVQSTNLQINDKNIELAYGQSSPSDSVATGGGITLHGTTDHTITWVNNGSGWNFNDNTNITSTASSYLIGGNAVVNATSLGNVIKSAPGLTSLGILSVLTVTNVTIHDSTVQATGTNKTLYLSGTGTGTVDATGNRITSVAIPTGPYDATNKTYVDAGLQLVGSKGFTFSIDTTGMADPAIDILPYLNLALPIYNPSPYEYLNLGEGTRVRVICTNLSIAVPASPQQLITLNSSGVQVKDINNNTQTVIIQSGLAGIIPASTIIVPTVTRVVREYLVINQSGTLVWQGGSIVS